MTTNTLRKPAAYIQDNARPASDPAARRARIAQIAEAACGLPGNAESPDFEEFILQYSTRPTGDFA